MRIFWLGMHKILIQTELPRLRQLGFEVFCPPYRNKSSQHQSAANGWTKEQKTTLPPDVFDKLSNYNFFYHEISPKMMDLLNKYFDIVVVTIDPCWLIEVLRGFKGKIIYRTYGHVHNMSEFLARHGAKAAIQQKDDFWYVPHSGEYALHEDPWLRHRMEIVPYCVPNEVPSIKDTWQGNKNEIMISCPNISNPYYQQHFQYLKKHFHEAHYKFYGVQTTKTNDPQLVGTIPFPDLLDAYKNAAGFLYTYREPTVCFLPPIEMMIVGGPVIFLKGSLLDQYFGDSEAPGKANNETEAKEKCERLLNGDKDFITQIIASQKPVRAKYLPEDVWPLFDNAFIKLFNPNTRNKGMEKMNAKIPSFLYPAESPKLWYALTHPKWVMLKIKSLFLHSVQKR